VGAYATRGDIMAHVSPLGGVYQAGTLSGNPVAMAAGLVTLEKTGRPGFYEDLERKGARLEAGLARAAADAGVTASVVRQGSLFWTVFQPEAPRAVENVDGTKMPVYGRLHRALIERGVYLAPSGWEVGFLSAAHTDADIDTTVAAVADTFQSWS
ncbi:MAG TPA: aminotransferase class III-fold pyridoxal phosphate-dependent enzyme, partial [Candidatus Krumholzibacteria bacterium]|nr:aminotransferase class III-fold pyridoxal phosphate-dependent enzyme [Candidatus Krumholzibacteria bacterium]